MAVRDLPALWASEEWRADLESWLLPAVAATGRTVTGPVVQERIRFWSTVLHVETDAGRVWVKENAPSQAFEAALVARVEGLAPGRMPPVVGIDPVRGRLATADVGAPLATQEDVPDGAWVDLVSAWAGLQRDLADHGDDLLATGLSAAPETGIADWAAALADHLHGLPESDPRRLSDDERRQVEAGLPLVAADAGALVASGLPATLQHNDLHLGNAFHRPGAPLSVVDLADAVWAHPLTTVRIPLWTLAERRGGGDSALVRRVQDAAVEPWTDRATATELRALLPAADRISALHRAMSWKRLVEDVPLSAVPSDFRRSYAEWLLIATAPDPYALAVTL